MSSPEKANESMQLVKDAINKVSKERTNVGVTQNRLEYTLSNLEVTYANLSEANSRIRDVDYAKDISFDDACDTVRRIMDSITE